MDKLLSISIAAYNVENFLGETLASLVNDVGVMAAVDIIIVNDGSTDRTLQVAEKYRAKYPDSIRVVNKNNEGPGSTVNEGIDRAVGKYFMLLDGDDWFTTENMSDFLDTLKRCDADLIIAPYQMVYMEHGKEEEQNDHTYIPENEVSVNAIMEYKPIYMHEAVIKTSLLKNNGIYVSNGFYTDSELIFKALLFTESLMRYPRTLYRYRLEREGQSVDFISVRRHYKDKIALADHVQEAFMQRYDKITSRAWLKMLESEVSDLTSEVYLAYMIQNRPARYKEKLKTYDRKLKEDRRYIYDLSGRAKKVRLVRKLNFRFYRAVCAYVSRLAAKR